MQTQLQNRLTRSSQDRILAGVAGGLARYFAIDSTVMRLIMVVLFFAGIGFIIYPTLWLIAPRDDQATPAGGLEPLPGARFHPMTGQPLSEEEQSAQPAQPAAGPRSLSQRQQLFGVILLGLGGFILADMIFPWASHLLFPMLLIVAGVVLVSKSRRHP